MWVWAKFWKVRYRSGFVFKNDYNSMGNFWVALRFSSVCPSWTLAARTCHFSAISSAQTSRCMLPFSGRSAQGEPIWVRLLWCGAAILIQNTGRHCFVTRAGQESIGSRCTVWTVTSVNWHPCDSKSSTGWAFLWRRAVQALEEDILGDRLLKIESVLTWCLTFRIVRMWSYFHISAHSQF